MTKIFAIFAIAFPVHGAIAQQTAAVPPIINCENPANIDKEACLGLPDPNAPITNFVPLVAPVLGAAALAGLGGGGSASSTPSTPSTN
jgi:hypothetical protein|tara:strand:+ start:9265 stop:9528 length:264 start_codon:yes stop_codon:yes gene_type:complete